MDEVETVVRSVSELPTTIARPGPRAEQFGLTQQIDI